MTSARHRTLNWHVYNDIVRLISSGHYAPGSRLDEQQIAEELGVSRTPVREAIARLAKDALVVHRPYRGNFVRRFTPAEVADLYEVRGVLESLAVRLAIPNLTADALTELGATLRDIDVALAAADLDAYGFADRRFHELIAQLSGNQTLIDLLTHIAGQVQLIRTMANRDPSVVEITAMERPEIVEAMAAGDPDRACRLMEEHIALVRRNAIGRIEATEAAHVANSGDPPG